MWLVMSSVRGGGVACTCVLLCIVHDAAGLQLAVNYCRFATSVVTAAGLQVAVDKLCSLA